MNTPQSDIASQKISKAELESISMPDRLDTSIGELKFFDGVPTDATIDKLYDNLDRSRAVQAGCRIAICHANWQCRHRRAVEHGHCH